MLLILVAADIYFAATRAVTSAEGAVYSRYIARPVADTLSIPFDARIGVPYALLARIVKWAGGVSELTLRLPAVLGGLLFGASLIRMAPGWRTAAAILLFLLSDPVHVFSTAGGTALALGFVAAAFVAVGALSQENLWLAGILLGFAVASAPTWTVLAVAWGTALVVGMKPRSFWGAVDQFAIPLVLTSALFSCPMILARGQSLRPAENDFSTRVLILKIPTGKAVVLGVSQTIEPGVDFYRRRYHMSWIGPVHQDGPDREADYYLLRKEDEGVIRKRALKVLASEDEEILASR